MKLHTYIFYYALNSIAKSLASKIIRVYSKHEAGVLLYSGNWLYPPAKTAGPVLKHAIRFHFGMTRHCDTPRKLAAVNLTKSYFSNSSTTSLSPCSWVCIAYTCIQRPFSSVNCFLEQSLGGHWRCTDKPHVNLEPNSCSRILTNTPCTPMATTATWYM